MHLFLVISVLLYVQYWHRVLQAAVFDFADAA
jgi:hypothetical protein